MKTIKFLLAFLFIITLASCGKHSDGTSVWAGMLWILPVITGISAAIFWVSTVRGYLSGTEIRKGYKDKWVDAPKGTKTIPQWPLYAAIFFTALTIVIIILVNADK